MNKVELRAKAACLRAAKLIERKGWVQGKFQDDTGAHCMDGALAEVLFGDPLGCKPIGDLDWKAYYTARDAVERVIIAFGAPVDIPGDYGSRCNIIKWNDTPGRTSAEVLRVLREAAHTPESTPNPAGDE